MIARRAPRAMVVRCPDKLAAARHLCRAGVDVIVVDDGFQHQRLGRDLDIVIEPEAFISRLPRGELAREGRGALGRADLLWRHERSGEWPSLPCRAPGRSAAVSIGSRARPVSLVDRRLAARETVAALAGKSVFLLAGIALPGAFARMVANLGARIVGRSFAGDHRAFSTRHLAQARRSSAEWLLTTEKDLVRLDGSFVDTRLRALRCDLEVVEGRDYIEGVLGAIGRRRDHRPGPGDEGAGA